MDNPPVLSHVASSSSRFRNICHGIVASLCMGSLLLSPLATVSHAAAGIHLGGVSIKDENEMGEKFESMLRAHLSMIEDPEVTRYLTGIVERIVKVVPPQPFTFRTAAILHNSMNAFAVPGGRVFVFSGLVMNFDTEEELAGVLAHEIAHVTQRHVAAGIERSQVLTLGTLLLAAAGVALAGAGGGALALTAGQSAALKYSRIDENDADNMGYQYLVKAGYAPQGMAESFKKIRQKSWMAGSQVPTYLSTHPDIGDRITQISARVQSATQEVRNRKEDPRAFLRVKTLLWARYGEPQTALHMFDGKNIPSCLATMGKGVVHARQNSVTEARKEFDQAVTCAPEDPLILREAGTFHYQKGDLRLAEELLNKAIRLDSRDYMAQFYLARLLNDTDRATQAIPYYIDVLRYVPEDKEVHEAYARSLGKSGKTFLAYLHLAYAALYGKEKRKTEKYFAQAKGMPKSAQEQKELSRFEERYNERKKLWKW